jgi:hypothetical protein
MNFRGRRWSALTRSQRGWIAALGAVEIVLTSASLVDLARRPASAVRGPKALWALALLVQPAGPVAYLILGRRAG